ncbi:MAG: histidine phosphatase family protein, partial [Chloroflexota bacterium]
MQTVFLVRHGLRQDTMDRTWRETATWPDDPPLCEHGWLQARLAGAYLADKGIAAMYCSPFLRAVQTAQGIYERTGVRFRPEGALGEWLNPKWFSRVPELITPERIRRAYDGYDPAHRSTIAMAHPEEDERVEVYARV